MKNLALVASGLWAASVMAHPTGLAERQSTNIDPTILQFALTLEHLENAFYKGALTNFTLSDFEAAGYSKTYYNNLKYIAGDEQSHVTLLQSALSAVGITPVSPCQYTFPYTDVNSFITLSSVIEGVGTSAYLAGAPLITSKGYLTVAGSILITEALHTSYQRAAIGEVPMANPYGTPLDPTSVFTLAAMFITSCPASNAPLPFTPFPTLTYNAAGNCRCEGPDCSPDMAIKRRSEDCGASAAASTLTPAEQAWEDWKPASGASSSGSGSDTESNSHGSSGSGASSYETDPSSSHGSSGSGASSFETDPSSSHGSSGSGSYGSGSGSSGSNSGTSGSGSGVSGSDSGSYGSGSASGSHGSSGKGSYDSETESDSSAHATLTHAGEGYPAPTKAATSTTKAEAEVYTSNGSTYTHTTTHTTSAYATHTPTPGVYCAPPSVGATINFTAASNIPAGSYVTFVSGLNVVSVQGQITGTGVSVVIPSIAMGQTYVFISSADQEGAVDDTKVLFGPAIVEVFPALPAY